MNKTPVVPAYAWEWMWAPYDAPIYQLVLDQINADDIVLEIGAGDLRLSRQMAEKAEWVFAVEQNRPLLQRSSRQLPANIEIVAGDARTLPFPEGITAAVLLMRHCTHFALYFQKLQTGACKRLITNARWGMDIETIHFKTERRTYEHLEIGWYACRCGDRGFKPGPPQSLNEEIANQVWELDSCPQCIASRPTSSSHGKHETFSSTKGWPW